MFTKSELIDYVDSLKLTFETLYNSYEFYKNSDNKNLLDSIPEMIITDYEFYNLFIPIIRNELTALNEPELTNCFEEIVVKMDNFRFIYEYCNEQN